MPLLGADDVQLVLAVPSVGLEGVPEHQKGNSAQKKDQEERVHFHSVWIAASTVRKALFPSRVNSHFWWMSRLWLLERLWRHGLS